MNKSGIEFTNARQIRGHLLTFVILLHPVLHPTLIYNGYYGKEVDLLKSHPGGSSRSNREHHILEPYLLRLPLEKGIENDMQMIKNNLAAVLSFAGLFTLSLCYQPGDRNPNPHTNGGQTAVFFHWHGYSGICIWRPGNSYISGS